MVWLNKRAVDRQEFFAYRAQLKFGLSRTQSPKHPTTFLAMVSGKVLIAFPSHVVSNKQQYLDCQLGEVSSSANKAVP